MKKAILPALAVIIVALILYFAFGRSDQGVQDLTQPDRSQTTSESAEPAAGEGNYFVYSPENLAIAQERGRVVLYFWASWCPTCRVLDRELSERGDELPEGVTLLQVNYDTERELRAQYAITQQHTLVEIDSDGDEVRKWIGGGIETIKQQLN